MNDLSDKTVLITGTSSGIGRVVAVYLAQQGYTVLASVRKNADAESLNKLSLPHLKPLFPLDLTKQEQVHAIAAFVKQQINNKLLPPLYAIVNIAGGGQIAPVELMNVECFKEELEKRLVGPVLLLQELLPLLRVTKGRVIWISTPGLFPVPYVADIHAPDFAVNYLARTLNIELLPDGIKNILIRCGGINTTSPERTETQLVVMLNNEPCNITNIYKDRLLRLREEFNRFDTKRTDPVKVAMVIAKALSVKHPKIRYQVGYMSGLGSFFEKLPQIWVDKIMEKRER